MDKHPEIIAFYLPQYHPFKENDEWWGKGFTEWTNVGKAKPLFKGHNQPRVPTELGYYDLRLPIIREQQAQMAREAGVTAFCYWHYWFGNGKRLLEDIFDEVLNSGHPDFPFCLGWANHSWYAKNWNADGSSSNKLLIEQTYPGIEDEKLHFEFLLKAFQDPRYVKINGKPLLYIFSPQNLPNEYVNNLIQWTKNYGFPGLFLVANLTGASSSVHYTKDTALSLGYSAVSYQRLADTLHRGHRISDKVLRKAQIILKKICSKFNKKPPFMVDYSQIFHSLITDEEYNESVIPAIVPQWDHTPRSGWNGSLFVNAKPYFFYEHVKDALKAVSQKTNPIIFLKSWNEWGEGNMMEPDLTYGRGYIDALRNAINDFIV